MWAPQCHTAGEGLFDFILKSRFQVSHTSQPSDMKCIFTCAFLYRCHMFGCIQWQRHSLCWRALWWALKRREALRYIVLLKANKQKISNCLFGLSFHFCRSCAYFDPRADSVTARTGKGQEPDHLLDPDLCSATWQ